MSFSEGPIFRGKLLVSGRVRFLDIRGVLSTSYNPLFSLGIHIEVQPFPCKETNETFQTLNSNLTVTQAHDFFLLNNKKVAKIRIPSKHLNQFLASSIVQIVLSNLNHFLLQNSRPRGFNKNLLISIPEKL